MPHDGPAAGVHTLTAAEADLRRAVLGQLKEALSARDIASELVGRRTLVLRSDEGADEHWPPALHADPRLYVFAAETVEVVTTDGQHYQLGGGRSHPADDPRGAARLLTTAVWAARA
jgi:hypothetical protein